jgi:hypothetical protein
MRLHHRRAVGAREQLAHAPERHEERRARGDREDDGAARARAKAQEGRVDVGGRVVDQAVHREDVVEGPKLIGQHVARVEGDAGAVRLGQAPGGDLDKLRRDVGRHHRGAARASSAVITPGPQPASSTRSPRRSSGSRDSMVARIRSRPSRTVWRIRDTGASEVSRSQTSVAVRSK